jgi:uncharacterized protein
MSVKPHIRLKARPTADTIQNLITRTGLGTGNANDGARYGLNPITRNRVQLEHAYRGSWICGLVVDAVAEDMTREGVDVQSDESPDRLQELDKAAKSLRLWDKLCETIKWGRLYGGAVGIMLIDGQDASTPLRRDTIGKGQFKGILPVDRWMLQPSFSDFITELGPDMGKPTTYEVMQDAEGLQRMRVHHSRVIRIEGVKLPYNQRTTENGWGASVLERPWDRLIAFDSTTAGTAQLVYKAHLRTYKVKDLREIIAAGGPAYEGLLKQINMIRAFQSNEGMTLMDLEDEFEAHQYTFSGLDAVLLQFGQQLSGAVEIPLVRLFGQSPAGLNSTGESDIRNYYDSIKRDQESDLRPGVELMYEALYRSTFGREPPKQFGITFRPLWQMSKEQLAEITAKLVAAIVGAYEAQIIDRATAMKELKQIAATTGTFSNIEDKAIKEAESDPPPTPEVLGLKLPDPGPSKTPGARKEGAAGNSSS